MSDTKIDDGGPAFPSQELDAAGNPRDVLDRGMTLRDYFAAKAMQGWAANGQMKVQMNEDGPFGSMARWCYQLADAMLAARKNTNA